MRSLLLLALIVLPALAFPLPSPDFDPGSKSSSGSIARGNATTSANSARVIRSADESRALPFDPNEEAWPETVLSARPLFFQIWKKTGEAPSSNRDYLTEEQMEHLPNTSKLVTQIKDQVVDDYLRKKVDLMAENKRRVPVFVDRGINTAALYALSGNYFCADEWTVYSLSIAFNFSEPRRRHMDHTIYDSAKFGNETLVSGSYSCMGQITASEVQLIRHTEHQMEDLHIKMDHVNKVLANQWALFQVERTDRSREWIVKQKEHDERNSSVEVPTYNAGNSFGGGEKVFIYLIQDLFTKVVNIGLTRRIHTRCSLFEKGSFYSEICRDNEAHGTRSFWKSSRGADAEEYASIDLYALIEAMLEPIGMKVCHSKEASPSQPLLQSSVFAMKKDVPSFWEIDEVKTRVHRQRFLKPYYEPANTTMVIQAIDRSDVRLKLIKQAGRQEHVTPLDMRNMRFRSYIDCHVYTNKESNDFFTEYSDYNIFWKFVYIPKYVYHVVAETNCERILEEKISR